MYIINPKFKMTYFQTVQESVIAKEIFFTAYEIGQFSSNSSEYIELFQNSVKLNGVFGYMVLLEGTATIDINGKEIPFQLQDSLLFRLDSSMQIRSTNANFIYLIFGGNESEKIFTSISNGFEYIKFEDHTNITMHYYKIKECLSNPEIMNEAYISVSINCILAEVYTIHHYHVAIGDQVNMVTLAMDYIENNYMNDITLEDISKSIRYSQYYFSRVFKKRTGFTPYEYIIQKRINYSKHLLTNTPLSISEISANCGYENPISFNNSFKRHVGVSPKQYRIAQQSHMEA
jgi:AraC-like DNA-binding protein